MVRVCRRCFPLLLLAPLTAAPGCDLAAGSAGAGQAISGRTAASPGRVTALGRLEPKDGIRRVAGPSSRPSVVIGKLLVEEGDRIQAGQPIAELDTVAEDKARVARAKAELKNAERELARIEQLITQRIATDETRDKAQFRVEAARADRIIHLEEGRLSSFSEAVQASTQRLLVTLAKSNRGADLRAQVAGMPPGQFTKFLEGLTAEASHLLEVMTLGADAAFEVMLSQMIEVLTLKVGQLLDADRVSLFLADSARGELYSLVAQAEGGRPLEIRIPASTGIAGHVFRSGQPLNVPDAYEHSLFNRELDQRTGYRTKSVLCVPIADQKGEPFAVMSLLNKKKQAAFDARDEEAARDLATQLGIVLRTWHQAHQARAAGRGGAESPRLPLDLPGKPRGGGSSSRLPWKTGPYGQLLGQPSSFSQVSQNGGGVRPRNRTFSL